MKADIEPLREYWDEAANVRPYEAVLEGFDGGASEFYENGRVRLIELLAHSSGFKVRGKRILDFGCGPGRLTKALADSGADVVGLDVSPVMLDLARKHVAKADFRLVEDTNLGLADREFDLVISVLTLQHVMPDIAKDYLKQLVKAASAGIIQITTSKDIPEGVPPEEAVSIFGDALLDDVLTLGRGWESHVYYFLHDDESQDDGE